MIRMRLERSRETAAQILSRRESARGSRPSALGGGEIGG
jgi:hypothetical protein